MLRGISVAGSIVKVCITDRRLAAGARAVGKPLISPNKAAQITQITWQTRSKEWEQRDKRTGEGELSGHSSTILCLCEVFSAPDWMYRV